MRVRTRQLLAPSVGALLLAGCGGGGEVSLEGYSAPERRAIEQAQTILANVYDLDVDEVTEVDRNEFGNELTRVEVETSGIKSGPACAELVYDGTS